MDGVAAVTTRSHVEQILVGVGGQTRRELITVFREVVRVLGLCG